HRTTSAFTKPSARPFRRKNYKTTITAIMRGSSALKYLFLPSAPMEQSYNRTVYKSQLHRARHPTRYDHTPLSVRMILPEPIATSYDLRVVILHELRHDGRSLACH